MSVPGENVAAAARMAEERALWQRFADGADPAARWQLIERYLPLCRMIAASLYARRVADDAEFADYMQYATLGLIEAVDNFDWQRGVQFNTFATYRIQGAIRNSMPSFSERREQIGLLARLKKERAESIKHDEGEPRERRRERAGRVVHEMAEVAVMSALSYLLEGSGMLALEADPGYVEHFYDGAELRELRRQLLELVEALPDQERRVVKYHYLQNLEFTEIARLFGVTKGRISQIHKRALLLLREARRMTGGLDFDV